MTNKSFGRWAAFGCIKQMSNLDRYKKDLKSLIATGEQLLNAINAESFPDQFEAETKKKIGAKKAKEFIAALRHSL